MTLSPLLFIVLLALMFALGVLYGRVVVGRPRARQSRPPLPSRLVARASVRFEFADGRSEEKRMFSHSLTSALSWRGRQFRWAQSDGETLIYREVADE